MKRLVTVLAALSSIAALIVIAGGGLTLLAIENSGERGMGALLALGGLIASAAVAVLIFVRDGSFGGGAWRAAAIGAAIVGALPVAALAYVAIRFAGFPLGSRMPILDWSVLAAGILLGFGAISILALGHRRSQEKMERNEVEPNEEAPIVHMQQIRHAQRQLRSAFEADSRASLVTDQGDDDIRVRRV